MRQRLVFPAQASHQIYYKRECLPVDRSWSFGIANHSFYDSVNVNQHRASANNVENKTYIDCPGRAGG